MLWDQVSITKLSNEALIVAKMGKGKEKHSLRKREGAVWQVMHPILFAYEDEQNQVCLANSYNVCK